MHVISRKRLNEFAQIHPQTKSALVHWYKLVKQKDFSSFFSLTPSLWEGWGGPGVSAPSQGIRAASMAARRFDEVTLRNYNYRAQIILGSQDWVCRGQASRTARGHRGRALMKCLIDSLQALH